ncbi:putative baseplate assembly protein [Yoonia sp. BS5-3]|uniref:Baseplate assembly protein n=1 Tax=Yoonia phaeophyticola TaxID=3137369 RepID=A0ABZ2V6U3_9RHOB
MALRTRSFLDERREMLAASPAAVNGIAGIEITGAAAILRFVKDTPGAGGVPNVALGPSDFQVIGGDRIRGVAVETITPNGDDLLLTFSREGDFSTYTLVIDPALPGYDPILREIPFRFRVHCDTDLDCEADPDLPPAPPPEPRLDYLARDYESYRAMMLDRLAVTTPTMTERHPASLEMTIVEWMAALGDELSYKLDKVATEYSLETARLRQSAARHAQLIGYAMHNGASARVLAQVNVSTAFAPSASDLTFVTNMPSLGAPVVAQTRLAEAHANGALIFEPKHDMTLTPAHNRIALHHWGDPDAILAEGATEAWLRDPDQVLTLSAGDLLILVEERDPATGQAADADPTHRQAVRLIADPETVEDPLEIVDGSPLRVHRITWAANDALGFSLCVGARAAGQELAHILGNIVVADHGYTLENNEPLGIAPLRTDPELVADPALPGPPKSLAALDRARPFAPRLQHKDLTFSAGPFTPGDPTLPASQITAIDPGQTRADIYLSSTLEPDRWAARRDLLEDGPNALVFVPEVTADGTTTLRFGRSHGDISSTHGKTPVAGDEFAAHYRIGTGPSGNIGAGALAHIAASPLAIGNVISVTNPLPAAGGTGRETIAEVRQRAPVSFHKQQRAVTLADYENLLNAHPEVQRAHARKRWLGGWSAIFLSVDRIGSMDVDDAFKEMLLNYIEPQRMMGHDVTIDAPIYVPLTVALKACVADDHFAEDVEDALQEAFSTGYQRNGEKAFFHPDNVTFSSRIYLSHIYRQAMAIPGVRDIHVLDFRRAAANATQAIDEGLLTFGPREIPVLANDPNYPDQGRLTITAEGGR